MNISKTPIFNFAKLLQMADRSNDNMALSARTSVRFEGLNYRQSADGNKIEICDWVGTESPALWTHMHDEHQLSIVHFGLRRFTIANRSLDVASGEMIFIPANTPHASVGLPNNATVSQEMFFAPADVQLEESADVTISCIPNFLKKTDLTPECLLDAAVQNWSRRIASLKAVNFPAELLDAVKSTPMLISEIADGASMSCEGFIRKFSRLVGMTPLEFRLAHKAKAARALLRLNIPPASVACDVGFSDQSHLGRIFKRSFGTSPARYRSIWSD